MFCRLCSNESLFCTKHSRNGQERCISSLKDFKGDGTFPCFTIEIMEEVRNSFCKFMGVDWICEDLGKVLAGIQVPDEDGASFDEFLKKLDYGYVEETQNPIYQRFLSG